MKTKFYVPLFVSSAVLLNVHLSAQTNTFPSTGSAGIGTITPSASSILEMKSTTQGMLVPRMTLSQRNAIISPATGLMVYQTNSTPGFYYYSGSAWKGISGANTSLSNLAAPTLVNTNLVADSTNKRNVGSSSIGWRNIYATGALYLDGIKFIDNAGTNNTAIGAAALNNLTSGYDNTSTGFNALYSNTTGFHNTANGEIALYKNKTGNNNSAIGVSALYSNISGSNNTAIGDLALTSNTASGNTAIGANALFNNTTADGNTATGFNSLYFNSTGNRNTATGYYSLYSNTTGYENTVAGYKAFYSNTTGVKNTANGSNALYSNTTGGGNTAVGESSMYTNTTGSYNTSFGNGALVSNTTGNFNAANGYYALAINATGKNNTASGYYALYSNTVDDNTANGSNSLFYNSTGNGNTANGSSALYSNSFGSYNLANGYYALYSNNGYSNTANGADALYNNTSGGANTANGTNALYSNATGSYLTGDGYFTDVNADGYSDASAIGTYALVTASNQVRIGDSYATSIGGYVNWSNISDGRVKKNIRFNVPGLAFINRLKPVTYNLDLDAADKIIQKPALKNSEKNIRPSAALISARNQKEQIIYSGFVAQDVEKTAKEIGYDFSGVDAAKNDQDLYGLRYADFVVPLVKAVQELSEKNNELKSEVQNLKSEMNELKTIVLAGSQSGFSMQRVTINEKPETAKLEQNIPNPFNNTTTINYTLPPQYSSAKIIITGKTGSSLREIILSGNGRGSLNIEVSTLASGAYHYSLYIDGKVIDSKQMVLSK
jgi:hypothetical protein